MQKNPPKYIYRIAAAKETAHAKKRRPGMLLPGAAFSQFVVLKESIHSTIYGFSSVRSSAPQAAVALYIAFFPL